MENKSVELYLKYSSTTNWISKKQYTVDLSSTENLQTNEIQFKYCPIQQNDADILTKPLLGNRFWSMAGQLGLTI